MKRLVFIMLCLIAGACSQDEPRRQLTAKDLAYTVWYKEEYVVNKGYSSSGYFLNIISTTTITFTDEGKFIESTSPKVDPSSGRLVSSGGSWGGRYRIVKNMYFEDDQTYTIVNYTGDRFEAIPTDETSDNIAQASGFGYTRKYVFRKVKL